MDQDEPGSGPAPRDDESLFPRTVGDRLRAAREAQGLTLADIAARTRVPLRHLEAIETGDYSSIPTPTYAIGFAKAYARAVGEDEVTIARDVRSHTAATSRERHEYQPYEMDDPTRVPPRGLALTAAAIAVLIVIGALIWLGSGWFGGGGSDQPATSDVAATDRGPAALVPVPAPAPAMTGQVTLTALDRVWVRVHDGAGKTLFENTMNQGDQFQVPTGTDHPTVSAGRPDKLQITVDGGQVPPLGNGARPVKDVPIDAASLRTRQQATPGAATAAATPTVTPSAAPTPAPTATAAAAARTTSSRPTPKPSRSKTPSLAPKPAPPPLAAPTGIY